MTTRLLLAGGGHAHVHVLAEFAARPPRDRHGAPVAITLVSPFAQQWYSGMLPGWMAGTYPTAACVIPLPPLAARAGAHWVPARIVRLDLAQRVAITDSGTALPFDVLSIDTGPVADIAAPLGAAAHAQPLRPLESFTAAWSGWLAQWRTRGAAATVAVIGGGAGGVELALAAAAAARRYALALRVHLMTGPRGLLPDLPAAAARHASQALARAGATVLAGPAAALEAGTLTLAGGSRLDAEAIILATGARAADWPRAAGLAVDAEGFIRVDRSLRSVSHPAVFAAGDCASMDGAPRPRSGVYAVRAGPPLAGNLRLQLAGQPLRPYTPQRRALYLLNTGDGRAIGIWGPLVAESRWLWQWKDRIDRAFVARYANAPTD